MLLSNHSMYGRHPQCALFQNSRCVITDFMRTHIANFCKGIYTSGSFFATISNQVNFHQVPVSHVRALPPLLMRPIYTYSVCALEIIAHGASAIFIKPLHDRRLRFFDERL
jgi:hypothetical protein